VEGWVWFTRLATMCAVEIGVRMVGISSFQPIDDGGADIWAVRDWAQEFGL
jgi:hypothetical protein